MVTKTTYTLAQNSKTRAAVSAETAEKLRTLLAPAEDAHSEYVVSGEADYAVSFDDGVEPDFVLIYIDDGRAYADYGNGALPPQVWRRRYAICSMHAQGNKK